MSRGDGGGGDGTCLNFLHNHPEGAEKKRELSHIDTYTQQHLPQDAVMPQRVKHSLRLTRDGFRELKV